MPWPVSIRLSSAERSFVTALRQNVLNTPSLAGIDSRIPFMTSNALSGYADISFTARVLAANESEKMASSIKNLIF